MRQQNREANKREEGGERRARKELKEMGEFERRASEGRGGRGITGRGWGKQEETGENTRSEEICPAGQKVEPEGRVRRAGAGGEGGAARAEGTGPAGPGGDGLSETCQALVCAPEGRQEATVGEVRERGSYAAKKEWQGRRGPSTGGGRPQEMQGRGSGQETTLQVG